MLGSNPFDSLQGNTLNVVGTSIVFDLGSREHIAAKVAANEFRQVGVVEAVVLHGEMEKAQLFAVEQPQRGGVLHFDERVAEGGSLQRRRDSCTRHLAFFQ